MNAVNQTSAPTWLNKVPAVALSFWVIKILSTTVGETVADFLAVNAGFGQGPTRTVMFSLLAIALTLQLPQQDQLPDLQPLDRRQYSEKHPSRLT